VLPFRSRERVLKVNAELVLWALVVAGFIPWWVGRQAVVVRQRGRRRVQVTWRVRAIFWQVAVERQGREWCTWHVSAPLIRRFADAIWTAVRSLVK
jgi:hypothetical protein